MPSDPCSLQPAVAMILPRTSMARLNQAHLNELLTSDLLYPIATLARPTSTIPASCKQLHLLCKRSHGIHIAWRNSVLLDTFFPEEVNGQVAQSVIGNRLLSSAPQPLGDDVQHPPKGDPFFTREYLQHLYRHTFFRRHTGSEALSPEEEEGIRSAGRLLAGLDALCGAMCNCKWWRPVTDALSIPVLCIQAGRLDLLEYSLELFTSIRFSTTVIQLAIPWSTWAGLTIPDHPSTLVLHDLVHLLSKPCPYPMALAVFALLEWSLPALKIVLRCFPSLSPRAIGQYASGFENRGLVYAVFRSLESISLNSVSEIIDLYRWLDTIDLPGFRRSLALSLSWARFPPDWVKQALIEVDVPFVIAAADHEEDVEEGMGGIINCIRRYGAGDLLAPLLQHGLMGFDHWTQLVRYDMSKWWSYVEENVAAKDMQRAIAMQALFESSANAIEPGPTRQNTANIAQRLQVDFNTDLVDVVLAVARIDRIDHLLYLFVSLNEASLLPPPLSALDRLLAYFESGPLPGFDLRRLELCALTALFYFHACRSEISSAPHEWLRTLSPTRLAILTTTVLIGTSLDEEAMDECFKLDTQKAFTESLVAFACPAFDPTSVSAPTEPFFDHVALGIRLLVRNMVCELLTTPTVETSQDDCHYRNPAFSKWITPLLVQLDAQFTALSVVHIGWEREAMKGCAGLIPKHDQDCAKLSRSIIHEVTEHGVHGAARYRSDAMHVPKEFVLHAVQRRLATDAFPEEEDLVLKGNVLESIELLYASLVV